MVRTGYGLTNMAARNREKLSVEDLLQNGRQIGGKN
jgi:hypothetical protein